MANDLTIVPPDPNDDDFTFNEAAAQAVFDVLPQSVADCGLSVPEAIFAYHYMLNFNAYHAYESAGGDVSDEARARDKAARMMRRIKVAKAIGLMVQDRLAITKTAIIDEIGRLAFSNFGDIASWDEWGRVNYRQSSELTREQLATVAALDYDVSESGVRLKVRQHDKVGALKLLARVSGMESIELTGKNGGAIKVVFTTEDESLL